MMRYHFTDAIFKIFLVVLLGACSSHPLPPTSTQAEHAKSVEETNREISALAEGESKEGDPCSEFDTDYSAEQKLSYFWDAHTKSVALLAIENGYSQKNDAHWEAKVISNGASSVPALGYTEKFLEGFFSTSIRATAATLATLKFLAPDIPAPNKAVELALGPSKWFLEGLFGDAVNTGPRLGFTSLKPTFARNCELFPSQAVKKVHALGTLGKGVFTVYPSLKRLDKKFKVIGEVTNPWTGLLAAKSSVPVLMRYSIANPIGPTFQVTIAETQRDLLLEFIPGLGLKFLVDNHRSIDLVAMDSLAGQGADQNFFKYEFSPDFSRTAPLPFNTASTEWIMQIDGKATSVDKAWISARYKVNFANSYVMGLVGKRFAQVIPSIAGIDEKDLKPHSSQGPHPFAMSIEGLAEVSQNGLAVAKTEQRRPWRLVFVPALDNIDESRRALITDKSPFKFGSSTADFRYKLANLNTGDRVYYVHGETQEGERYLLGEITLTSGVVPSTFADSLYFVQHRLEMGRVDGKTISNPILESPSP